MKKAKMVLILTTTVTGLVAGLFFAWTFSVTRGLANLSNSEYISAMQSLNKAIQNGVFFICFFGAAILLPISAFIHYQNPLSTRFWYLLFAAIIYLAGVMGVTISGNIPLNQMLDNFNLHSASLEEIAHQRAKFELPWNRLNNIRTITSEQ